MYPCWVSKQGSPKFHPIFLQSYGLIPFPKPIIICCIYDPIPSFINYMKLILSLHVFKPRVPPFLNYVGHQLHSGTDLFPHCSLLTISVTERSLLSSSTDISVMFTPFLKLPLPWRSNERTASPSSFLSSSPCTSLLPTQCHLGPRPISLLYFRVEAAKLNLSKCLFQQRSGLGSVKKKHFLRPGRQREGKAIFLWRQLQADKRAVGRPEIYTCSSESTCKPPARGCSREISSRSSPVIPTHPNVLRAICGFPFTLMS